MSRWTLGLLALIIVSACGDDDAAVTVGGDLDRVTVDDRTPRRHCPCEHH